jgi:hypothetical protein
VIDVRDVLCTQCATDPDFADQAERLQRILRDDLDPETITTCPGCGGDLGRGEAS